MVANSSGLDSNLLLYATTHNDDLHIIQEYLKPLNQHFVNLDQLETLRQVLNPALPQTLIVVHHDDSTAFYKIFKKYDLSHLTTVLITNSSVHNFENSPFDFVLNDDGLLNQYLHQIIRYKQHSDDQLDDAWQRIQELEQQLEYERIHSKQNEVLKEAIVRNVSHELKTPLLHVKSAVSLIAEDMGKDNTLIRYAENATARLEALITNITMFGSSLDLNLGPMIVREAVDYAHRNLYRIWESKSQAQRINLYLDEDLPLVEADRQGISTILQLLLDNALKFSESEIEVHAHVLDKEVEITVTDYGIGIASEEIASIFDSFYQIDPSSTRRYGGTGVGLALVKLIIEKHKSQIRVESELGKGSSFSFNLPIINL